MRLRPGDPDEPLSGVRLPRRHTRTSWTGGPAALAADSTFLRVIDGPSGGRNCLFGYDTGSLHGPEFLDRPTGFAVLGVSGDFRAGNPGDRQDQRFCESPNEQEEEVRRLFQLRGSFNARGW